MTAAFAVKNISPDGCAPYNAGAIGAGGGGPSGVTDFPIKFNVSISPGQTWTYQEKAAFYPPGQYRFTIYVQDLTLSNPNNLTKDVSINISACPTRPLRVTTGLRLSTTEPMPGDTVAASFAVTNTAPVGCGAFTAKFLGVGGRGPGGDSDVQDFPLSQNVTFLPETPTPTALRRSSRTLGDMALKSRFRIRQISGTKLRQTVRQAQPGLRSARVPGGRS